LGNRLPARSDLDRDFERLLRDFERLLASMKRPQDGSIDDAIFA
jgi:hypothetical protein